MLPEKVKKWITEIGNILLVLVKTKWRSYEQSVQSFSAKCLKLRTSGKTCLAPRSSPLDCSARASLCADPPGFGHKIWLKNLPLLFSVLQCSNLKPASFWRVFPSRGWPYKRQRVLCWGYFRLWSLFFIWGVFFFILLNVTHSWLMRW